MSFRNTRFPETYIKNFRHPSRIILWTPYSEFRSHDSKWTECRPIFSRSARCGRCLHQECTKNSYLLWTLKKRASCKGGCNGDCDAFQTSIKGSTCILGTDTLLNQCQDQREHIITGGVGCGVSRPVGSPALLCWL